MVLNKGGDTLQSPGDNSPIFNPRNSQSGWCQHFLYPSSFSDSSKLKLPHILSGWFQCSPAFRKLSKWSLLFPLEASQCLHPPAHGSHSLALFIHFNNNNHELEMRKGKAVQWCV